jgi:hypothetical protein
MGARQRRHGQGQQGGLAARHFIGEARPADRSGQHGLAEFLVQHLGHQRPAFLFDTLAGGQHHRARGHQTGGLAGDRARGRRGHGEDHQLRAVQGVRHVGGGAEPGRQVDTRQALRMMVPVVDRLRHLRRRAHSQVGTPPRCRALARAVPQAPAPSTAAQASGGCPCGAGESGFESKPSVMSNM